MADAARLDNRVRALRGQRALSQGALAARSGLSRQSINAIEAGRATPRVDVAVRIAAALGVSVEALFGGASSDALDAQPASVPRAAPGERVALAHIEGRWVAHALRGDSARLSADGIVGAGARGAHAVRLLAAEADARDNVVVMGCAPGLGLLADRLNARGGPGRFLWVASSSEASLAALGARTAHLAGAHVVDDHGRAANTEAARKVAHAGPLVVVTFARWQEGLVMRAEDRARIRAVADLARRGVRLVVREPGAGAQRLLERSARAAGVPARVVRDAPVRAAGHLDVARVIAQGGADVGVATADAARAWGLGFVPLAEERYDLVVPAQLSRDARVARLFDALVSRSFRAELDALGYDASCAGETVAEVAA